MAFLCSGGGRTRPVRYPEILKHVRSERNVGIVVFGAQWGDEGKGRLLIIRLQGRYGDSLPGGNNAGHTVVALMVTYKLHLIPSGILSKGKRA